MKKSKIVICILVITCITLLICNIKQYIEQENLYKCEEQKLADAKENTLRTVLWKINLELDYAEMKEEEIIASLSSAASYCLFATTMFSSTSLENTNMDFALLYTSDYLLYLSQNLELINSPETTKTLEHLANELGYVIHLDPKDEARQQHITKFLEYAKQYGENVELDWTLE